MICFLIRLASESAATGVSKKGTRKVSLSSGFLSKPDDYLAGYCEEKSRIGKWYVFDFSSDYPTFYDCQVRSIWLNGLCITFKD